MENKDLEIVTFDQIVSDNSESIDSIQLTEVLKPEIEKDIDFLTFDQVAPENSQSIDKKLEEPSLSLDIQIEETSDIDLESNSIKNDFIDIENPTLISNFINDFNESVQGNLQQFIEIENNKIKEELAQLDKRSEIPQKVKEKFSREKNQVLDSMKDKLNLKLNSMIEIENKRHEKELNSIIQTINEEEKNLINSIDDEFTAKIKEDTAARIELETEYLKKTMEGKKSELALKREALLREFIVSAQGIVKEENR